MKPDWDTETLARLQRLFREEVPKNPVLEDNETLDVYLKDPYLIRPQARKFLIRAARWNIPFDTQQRIFALKYNWKFMDLLALLKERRYHFEVFPSNHPFEILCTAIENREEQSNLFEQLKMVDPTTHNSHLIYVAARQGNLELIKKLLEYPFIDIHTDNPMMIACEFGHFEVVKLLYSLGADPSLADSFGFRLACENGHYEVVQLLINDERVNVNAQNGYALKQAIEENHPVVAKLLLDCPRMLKGSLRNLVIWCDAIRHGGKMLRLLLSQPQDNYFPKIAEKVLCNADSRSISSYSERLRVLLANPDYQPTSELLPHCCVYDQECLNLVIRDDRCRHFVNESLEMAIEFGYTDLIRFIFENYVSMFQQRFEDLFLPKNSRPMTAVQSRDLVFSQYFPLACENSHESVLFFLSLELEGLKEVDSPDMLKGMYRACGIGYMETVKLLVSRGVCPLESDGVKGAVLAQNLSIVSYLMGLDSVAKSKIAIELCLLISRAFNPAVYVQIFREYPNNFTLTFNEEANYIFLCDIAEGYQLVSYIVLHYPDQKRFVFDDSDPDCTVAPTVPILSLPRGRNCHVVLHYYFRSVLYLLAMDDVLLDEIMRHIFDYIIMTGFTYKNGSLCRYY